MDLESIIWVIIFLIYIASVILKRIRRTAKAKKTSPITHLDSDQADSAVIIDSEAKEKLAPKKRSRWKRTLTRLQGKFGDFLQQIQQEMEAVKQKDPEKETGWEKLLPPKDGEPEATAKTVKMVDLSITADPKDIKEDVASKDMAPMHQKVMHQRMAQPLRTVSSMKPKISARKIVAEKKDTVDAKKEVLGKGLAYSTQDLRKAVIWSEILAPPLALRDE
jgi:hypothetical protein